jgi:tetratricopeptide (TPR) repeat protein
MKRGALAAIALLLCAGTASADEPSVWGKARDPEAEIRRGLVHAAETLHLKFEHELRERRGRGMTRAEVDARAREYLRPAAALLEQVGAARSPDMFLRAELAELYSLLDQQEKVVTVLEGVVRSDVPPVLRARAWANLAQAYAHLGRTEDEINAYGKALETQPLARERARLLANRAEAYMLLGDVTSAVQGYRAALTLLSADYWLVSLGPTTLWGLAVALDRSGDLEGGMDAVRLARSYDPKDEQINGPNWFFIPEYDRRWYAALGHWTVARKADVPSVRVEAYARAVAELAAFVKEASPHDDRWLPLAKIRLKQCEKERDAFLKQASARPPSKPVPR